MPAVGRDIFDDSRLFAPAGVFLEGFTFFSYIEYQTVGLYILYKVGFIYIPLIGLYNLFDSRQVKKWKLRLYYFNGSPVDTSGIYTASLKGFNIQITT